MNLVEQASYLASILSILDTFDDASAARPQWLVDEYSRVWGEYKETVEKENKEREQRRQRERQSEARTAVTERRTSEARGDRSDHEREQRYRQGEPGLHGSAE